MKAQATRTRQRARRERAGNGQDPNKSLSKAFRILVCLAQNGPELGVIELSQKLTLNKTTVYRLLTAMERFGVIEQNQENEKYRLGLRLFELGNSAVQSRALQGQARDRPPRRAARRRRGLPGQD
jgi:DNA-binding IclR family transcriptional regulator